MSRMIFCITDEDIRSIVNDQVNDAESEEWIAFPDSESRSEFIEELIESVIDRIENNGMYTHDYFNMNDVLDLANDYGYTVTEA